MPRGAAEAGCCAHKIIARLPRREISNNGVTVNQQRVIGAYSSQIMSGARR